MTLGPKLHVLKGKSRYHEYPIGALKDRHGLRSRGCAGRFDWHFNGADYKTEGNQAVCMERKLRQGF